MLKNVEMVARFGMDRGDYLSDTADGVVCFLAEKGVTVAEGTQILDVASKRICDSPILCRLSEQNRSESQI